MSITHITVTIPVRKYIKLYLQKKHTVDPFILRPKNCHLSSLLFGALKPQHQPLYEYDAKYDDVLVVAMPPSVARCNRFLVDQEVIRIIDTHIQSLFDDEMLHAISLLLPSGIQMIDAIRQFLDYYHITEDDLPMDTVVKRFYRSRNPDHWRKVSDKRKTKKPVLQSKLELDVEAIDQKQKQFIAYTGSQPVKRRSASRKPAIQSRFSFGR